MNRNTKDLNILRDELNTDTLVRGYSGMSDEQVVTDIMTLYRTKKSPVNMTELREWAAIDERAININAAITTGSTQQIKNVALVADKLLGASEGNLNPGNQAHIDLITVLVDGSVITAADRTALITKSTSNISRAEELGLGKVQLGHVILARMI